MCGRHARFPCPLRRERAPGKCPRADLILPLLWSSVTAGLLLPSATIQSRPSCPAWGGLGTAASSPGGLGVSKVFPVGSKVSQVPQGKGTASGKCEA